jgi:hypothetical protein
MNSDSPFPDAAGNCSWMGVSAAGRGEKEETILQEQPGFHGLQFAFFKRAGTRKWK